MTGVDKMYNLLLLVLKISLNLQYIIIETQFC